MSAPVPPPHVARPLPSWLRFLREWSVPAVVLVIAGGAVSMGVKALNDRFTSVSTTVSNVSDHVKALDTTVTAANGSNVTSFAALNARLDQRFDRSEDDIKDGIKTIVASENDVKESIEKIRLSVMDLHQKVDKISAKIKVDYVPELPSGSVLDLIANGDTPVYTPAMSDAGQWWRAISAEQGGSKVAYAFPSVSGEDNHKYFHNSMSSANLDTFCNPVNQDSRTTTDQLVEKLKTAGIQVVIIDGSNIKGVYSGSIFDKKAMELTPKTWRTWTDIYGSPLTTPYP